MRFITSSGTFATGGMSFRNGFAVASMPTFVTTLSSRADISRSVPSTPGRINTSLSAWTLVESAQDLGARLAVIQQELDKLRLEHKTLPDAVATLDDLGARVKALEEADPGRQKDSTILFPL